MQDQFLPFARFFSARLSFRRAMSSDCFLVFRPNVYLERFTSVGELVDLHMLTVNDDGS